MRPADVHTRLVSALGEHDAVTFDQIVLVPETQNVDAREMLDWLAWARETGHIEDAGRVGGHKMYRLIPVGEAGGNGTGDGSDHGLGSDHVRGSGHGR